MNSFSKEILNCCGIYHLKQNNEVVYVGSSTNILARIASHTDKSFDDVSYYQCIKDVLNEQEAIDIFKYAPKYNKSMPRNLRIVNVNSFDVKVLKENKNKSVKCVLIGSNFYVDLNDVMDK